MRLAAFLDRHLFLIIGLCLAALALVLMVVAGCAAGDDGISPRDCADRDNAEVCAP